TRGWTACTSRESRASAGFPSRTGTARSGPEHEKAGGRNEMKNRSEATQAGKRASASAPGHKIRFGLMPKGVLFLAAVLMPLAAITWFVAVQAIEDNLTAEFTSKGTAIANTLASSGVDMVLTRDASTVQALVDQFAAIQGVGYVMVYDGERTLIAHTFAPLVPAGIIEKNLVAGEMAKQIREIEYAGPVQGKRRGSNDTVHP